MNELDDFSDAWAAAAADDDDVDVDDALRERRLFPGIISTEISKYFSTFEIRSEFVFKVRRFFFLCFESKSDRINSSWKLQNDKMKLQNETIFVYPKWRSSDSND